MIVRWLMTTFTNCFECCVTSGKKIYSYLWMVAFWGQWIIELLFRVSLWNFTSQLVIGSGRQCEPVKSGVDANQHTNSTEYVLFRPTLKYSLWETQKFPSLPYETLFPNDVSMWRIWTKSAVGSCSQKTQTKNKRGTTKFVCLNSSFTVVNNR